MRHNGRLVGVRHNGSKNSLKFKITKKSTEKAVYFVRFAMFEVAITKKPAVKAAKTSLL